MGTAIFGGVLIGLSAVLLMGALGVTAGISGIAAALLPPWRQGWPWRVPFVAGLLLGPFAAAGLLGHSPIGAPVANPALLIGAGLLVGVGTGVGRGCTSGHGVCGIARLSKRSFAATATFVAAAMLTVFVVRHVL
jgi:uncharacterized membrane protein YedE/YeeE